MWLSIQVAPRFYSPGLALSPPVAPPIPHPHPSPSNLNKLSISITYKNEDSKSSQFHCSKRHCHDWSEMSHANLLVKMLIGILLHSFDWTGKASVLLVEIQFQELLCKAWLRWQEYCRQAFQCRRHMI